MRDTPPPSPQTRPAAAAASAESSAPTRVTIAQPALTKYRIPVFAELAAREGLDLRVAYSSDGAVPNVEAAGFVSEYHPSRRLGPFTLRRFQFTESTRAQADVIVLPWATRELTLIPAMVRARASGMGVVLWGHGFSKQESALRGALRNGVARRAHSVLVYNRSTADALVAGGLDANRVFVAPNALDQAPIQAAREHWLAEPDRLAGFRREHDLGEGPVLLFVSRLGADRRADVLLRAGALLRDAHPDLRVAIVGDGPDSGRLRALSTELGLDDLARFPGAVYDETELAPWFLSASAFVYPVNIGLSLLHAMGYGRPVITSDNLRNHGPEIDALRPGHTGLTYKEADHEDLARVVGGLLGDDALRTRLGEAAHRDALERWSVPAMVDGFVEAIRHAAEHARG